MVIKFVVVCYRCVCGDDGWLPVRGVLVAMVGSVVAFGDDNLCVM